MTTEPRSTLCPACNGPLPAPAARGPARRYCSDRCRARASRARRAVFVGELVPPAPLEPAGAFLVGKAASTDDQVVAAVHETLLLVIAYRRLGSEARRQFAWRCSGMADALEAALQRYFKTPGATGAP